MVRSSSVLTRRVPGIGFDNLQECTQKLKKILNGFFGGRGDKKVIFILPGSNIYFHFLKFTK